MSFYRERDIARRLAAAVKKHGGLCPKSVAPGTDGFEITEIEPQDHTALLLLEGA